MAHGSAVRAPLHRLHRRLAELRKWKRLHLFRKGFQLKMSHLGDIVPLVPLFAVRENLLKIRGHP